MEKEQIISTLKAKVGNTSFTDRSFQVYVENNLPGEGIEPDDAYWTRHVNVIKGFQGQYNADVANSVNTQLEAKVAEYYSKNPDKLKEYLKAHPELLETKEPPQDDSKYNELLEEITKLKQANTDRDKKVIETEMRSKVLAKPQADKLFVNQALWEDAVKAAEFKEGNSVEDLYAVAKELYEKNYKRVFGDSATPYKSSHSNFTPEPDSKTLDDFWAKKKAREGWGK